MARYHLHPEEENMSQLEFPWARWGKHGQQLYCDECGYTLRQEDGVCEVCEENERLQLQDALWWETLDQNSQEED